MKAFLVFFALALFAMAAAQDRVKVANYNPGQVHVVDNNPSQVHVVDNNPYQGQGSYGGYNPGNVHVVDNNPGHVNVVDNNPNYPNNPNNVHVVDNNNPVIVPDTAFGQPDTGYTGNGGYEPISIGPEFVNQNNGGSPPYPYKPRPNPYARGGK